jgi:hypothetical protein
VDRLNQQTGGKVLHEIKSGFLILESLYFYLQNRLFVNEMRVLGGG